MEKKTFRVAAHLKTINLKGRGERGKTFPNLFRYVGWEAFLEYFGSDKPQPDGKPETTEVMQSFLFIFTSSSKCEYFVCAVPFQSIPTPFFAAAQNPKPLQAGRACVQSQQTGGSRGQRDRQL